jgi:hypothetical protein
MAPSASSPCRLADLGDDDEAGFPEQPLGSHGKYQVCLRWQPHAKPVAIPAKIGDPSLIKHVFLIIRENRTYDQILGDVAAGNGDPSLAVFGDGTAAFGTRSRPTRTRWCSASRSSTTSTTRAASRPTVTTGSSRHGALLRRHPVAGLGPRLSLQRRRCDLPIRRRATCGKRRPAVSFKNYGEYIENNTFLTAERVDQRAELDPDFYNDSQCLAYEHLGGETTAVQLEHGPGSHSPLPNLINHTVQNYPQFDLGIPDQFRVDLWVQDFANDVANGTVPAVGASCGSAPTTPAARRPRKPRGR